MNVTQRQVLRLRMRDLAALASFFAVVMSRTVSVPVLVAFGVAWLGSFAQRRIFLGRPTISAIVLLLCAIGLFGLAFVGVLDIVIAAVSFALLVTAQRLQSDPVVGTNNQVLLASLLLIAGAAALAGEIWFSLALLAFGIFACLYLGLTVLEGPGQGPETIELTPVVRRIGTGVSFALVGGLVFFFVFPRLSWNVAARRTPPSFLGATTGMSETVQLGGGGSIKTSPRVVMRVRLTPDPGDDRIEEYWVGKRFWQFDGKEWKPVAQPSAPTVDVNLHSLTAIKYSQQIELLPAWEGRTLVAIDMPAQFQSIKRGSTTGIQNARFVRVGEQEIRVDRDGTSIEYSAVSVRRPRVIPQLEDIDDFYRALPENLNPQVASLAKQVVGNESEADAIARRLTSWFMSNFQYTLELPGTVDDPLSDFLFNRRAGHCEHFATALAVMLRTQGVPSRVVTGFFGGERGADGYYLVRAGDAHAWTEAFVPGRGWVRFDATPDSGRRGQGNVLLGQLLTAFERLEEMWRSRVVDYSIQDQFQFVRRMFARADGSGAFGGSGDDAASPERTKRQLTSWVAIGLMPLVVLIAVVLRRRRAPSHPMASFLDRIESALTAQKIAFGSGEGLEEVADRLQSVKHPLAPAVQRVTKRYLEARFGNATLEKQEQAQLLESLRAK